MNYYIRKIRPNGRVKIANRWWVPEQTHMKYDGRCDGRYYYFYLYPYHETGLLGMVSTKEEYDFLKTANEDDIELHHTICGPELVDNSFPWYFWKPETK